MAPPDAILQQERNEPNAPDATFPGNAQLGQLADATPDTMSLHTKDAFRIFTGRGADGAGKLPPIPGGRRFAAVLKSIWHLSANDNPYADWILIRMYEGLVAIRAHLSRVITAREEAIEFLKRKGLSLAVMGSRSPQDRRARVSQSLRLRHGGGDHRVRLLRAHDQDPDPQGSHER
jgi:hypothetical protein